MYKMSEVSQLDVLICGGTSGIGLECAVSFATDGHKVTCVGRTKQHADESMLVLSRFDTTSVRIFDLTDEVSVKRLFDEIGARTSKLDVLVNSSGTISGNGIKEETISDWDRVISGNLRSAFLCSSLALPLLQASGNASIVNISSVCSLRPCTSLSYSVSKAGLDMMTKCMARDLAKDRIRVNSVNPGVVESNLQKSAGLFDSEEAYQQWIASMNAAHPLGRPGAPRDIASAVRFLCSSEASWITGAILSVDGGRAVA